jgi:hypothetical protein
MIEKVTVYKASDGSVHETEVSAQHRENEIANQAFFGIVCQPRFSLTVIKNGGP